MKKYIAIIFAVIVLSFYFFPFQFRFMPSVNSKMALAGIGLPIVMIALGKVRNALIDKDFFYLSIMAATVSLIGYISVVYNDTPDYTYASYVVSMWVWVCAAYVAVLLIRLVHGYVSVFLLCNYLIALCVAQCILALTMEFCVPIRLFIYSIIDENTVNFMEDKDRLMGLGCGLDVAGSRFSAVLVMIVYICINYQDKIVKYLYLYILSFIIISVVGNMIARTTTVGMIISILYFIIAFRIYKIDEFKKRFFFCVVMICLLVIPIIVYLYYNVPDFYKNVRFGFEGFFSIAEEGEWSVGSNDKLLSMYDVFPESLKTWLIGDGYFGATTLDPYYTGKEWRGFSFFMYRVAKVCMNRFSSHKLLFWMLLAINFIIWFKVSTDIFLVFALFLCIGKDDEDECQRRLLADNSL